MSNIPDYKKELKTALKKLNFFNCTLERMPNPPSGREAILSVIPKEGKNKLL